MPYVQPGIIIGLVLLVTGMAQAGGTNYGITPGSRPQVEGKIREWQVPTPKFARDPAPGPDGNIASDIIQKVQSDDYHGAHSSRTASACFDATLPTCYPFS